MIGKEYFGDEKIKRMLSGEPFWCCAAFIDDGGLQIIEPRESRIHMNWYNSFTKKDLEYYQYMLYGYPIKNVSVFDCQEDCREVFMLMLDSLKNKVKQKQSSSSDESKPLKIKIDKSSENADIAIKLISLGKIDADLIEFTGTHEKSLLERFCEAYENNSSQRFPKGGYTCTEKEYIPPIDSAAVRKTMKKISEDIKILDMLNMLNRLLKNE